MSLLNVVLVSSNVTIKYISQFKRSKSCYTRKASLNEAKGCVLTKKEKFCQSEPQKRMKTHIQKL